MTIYFLLISALVFNIYFLEKIIYKYILKINSKFLDTPNFRSMHKIPTPTGSGILIFLSALLIYSTTYILNSFYEIGDTIFLKIILISTPLSIVSFIDDYKNINQKIRYVCQLITGMILIFNANFLDINLINQNYFLYFILLFIFLFLITGLINIVNFMDGIDGLVLGVFAVIFSALTIYNDFNYIFFTSILFLFLKWNWNPAKLFIGDAGSIFLGTVYAGVIINSQDLTEAVSILLLGMPLILDSTFCLGWRFFNGFNIFKAHNMHLYQRLVKGGFSHKKVSLIYIFSVSFITLFYLLGNIYLELIAVIVTLIFGIFLNLKYASKLLENNS